MQELSNKVAVITGAASGIGLALAKRAAAEGMRVVMADIEAPALADAVAEIQATGAAAIGVVTDVANEASIQALADRAFEEFGAVHMLCNNAGYPAVVGRAGRFRTTRGSGHSESTYGASSTHYAHLYRA